MNEKNKILAELAADLPLIKVIIKKGREEQLRKDTRKKLNN